MGLALTGHACSLTLLACPTRWSEQDEFKDKVYFAKFDVDDLPALAQELGVRAMPTFVVFKNGEKADEFVGANPPALLKVVEKHVAP